MTWVPLRVDRFQLIAPFLHRSRVNVFDHVNSTWTKVLQRSIQERSVAFEGVLPVINYDIHATLQNGLRPKTTYSGTVKLVAVEGFDAVFFEQGVTIDIRAKNKRTWKEFAPSS